MNTEMNFRSADEIKPYPGLRCFQYKENYLFFGREGKAQEIASRLQQSHFVAVVGTSGSGKSSLVRAGLLPLLYGGMLYESGSHWRIAIMRPEETPIHNLAEALTYPVDFETEENGSKPKDENQIGMTEATLRRSGVGLIDFINNPANCFDEDENLLVVVDQFEELFRFKEKSDPEDTEAAAAFVKLLLEATRDKQGRIFVVITMRSDFLGDCSEFRDLPEAINDGQYLIPRMTRDQLRQSIESPAFVGDAQVSPALVNRLLNDLEDQNQSLDIADRIVKDHLPVLQHALMRTWDLWKRRGELDKPLDIEHYQDEEIGGMAHALSRHANEAFDDLDDKQKAIAEKMFKCLTETDSENREIRRPAKIEEICAVAGADKEEVTEIIEIFRDEKKGRTFLMPPEGVDLTTETKIDISHESLIRNWEILKGWVKDEARDAWVYRRISEGALLLREYKDDKRDELETEEFERNCKGYLWRGIELKAALKWRDTFNPNVNWVSRYQMLTETEKLELRELSRTSPASESDKRREFIQRHFDEMQDFLDKSAKNEAEIQGERERIQQERTLAAEHLAEVEREKSEGLKDLTESLKRQRKILFGVSIFSILLMLTASILAVLALQARSSAKLAKEDAETNEKEANKQKAIAIDEKKRAEDNLKEVQKQREIAGAEKKRAEEQSQKADEQKIIAERNEEKAKEQENRAKELANAADDASRKLKIANTDLSTQIAREQIAAQEAIDTAKRETSNRDGLISVERDDYLNAEQKFSSLFTNYDAINCATSKDPADCNKNKTVGKWWAMHNLGAIYGNLGLTEKNSGEKDKRFANAVASYKNALQILDEYKKSTRPDNNALGLFVNSPAYFLPASYAWRPEEKSDIDYSNIATMRRFARLYREFAKYEKDIVKRRQHYNDAIGRYNDLLSFLGLKTITSDVDKSIDCSNAKTKEAGKETGAKEKLYQAGLEMELAEIYFILDSYSESKCYYQSVANIYENFSSDKNFSDIIESHKKLSQIAFRQNDFEEAAKQAETGLILRMNVSAKPLYDPDIAESYAELGKIYKAQENQKTQKYKNTIAEYKKEVRRDDPALEEFLDNLTKRLDTSEGELNIDAPQNLATEKEKNIWDAVKDDLTDIDDFRKLSTNLSNVAAAITSFIDPESYPAEKEFERYKQLAIAYLEAGENIGGCNDSLEIIKDGSEKSRASGNIGLQINALAGVADFYNTSLQDPDEAGKVYRELASLLKQKEEALDKLDFRAEDGYFSYLTNAGDFFYFKNHYPEARQMYIPYVNFVERMEDNSRDGKRISTWSKDRHLMVRAYHGSMIGYTYELEGDTSGAIKEYEKWLQALENWKKSSTNLNPKDSDLQPWATILNAYFRASLAALHLDAKKNNEAMKLLPAVPTEMKGVPIFMIEGYTADLLKIGNYLKPQHKAQAFEYYWTATLMMETASSVNAYEAKFFFQDGEITKEYYGQYAEVLEGLRDTVQYNKILDKSLLPKFREGIETKLKDAREKQINAPSVKDVVAKESPCEKVEAQQ